MMTPRALNVAIVSPDRTLLRQLSWLLTSFGYQPLASAELEDIHDSLTAGDADLLIIDEAAKEVSLDQAPLLRRRNASYIYTLLLCDPHRMPELADAVEWGTDDVLQKPIDNGEVLARLRAAARFLEFERRLEEQATRDELTRLLTKSGLVAAMRRDRDDGAASSVIRSLVLVDLDFFSRIQRSFGHGPAHEVLHRVAGLVNRARGENEHAARVADNCFAVLTSGDDLRRGATLAEKLRVEIAGMRLTFPQGEGRVTASLVLTDYNPAKDEPLDLLETAIDAIAHAKDSGRNCIVRLGEHDEALAAWRKEVNAGNPFASATARDVMQPFGYLLKPGRDLTGVAERLRRSSVEYFPVVDRNGALVGVLGRDDISEQIEGSAEDVATAAGLLLQTPFTVAEETPFGEIVERFMSEEDPYVVVVRDREPRGYITRDGFLSLIEPIHTATFRPSCPVSASADYLAVPVTPSRTQP